MVRYEFVVFVAGGAGRVLRNAGVVEMMRRMCRERLGGEFDLTVVDVHDDWRAAETANVIATPTVLRVAPLPEVRVVGDLSVREQASRAIDLLVGGVSFDEGGGA